MSCTHENFAANAEVNRHTSEDGATVIAYSVDLSIICLDCEEPFCFRGVPLGISQMEPRMTMDCTVLRAPIHPMSDPTTGIGLPGFNVSVHQ